MSQQYLVTSDHIVGHDRGDTVDADALQPGTNLAALVAAGHLKAAPAPKPPAKEK